MSAAREDKLRNVQAVACLLDSLSKMANNPVVIAHQIVSALPMIIKQSIRRETASKKGHELVEF